MTNLVRQLSGLVFTLFVLAAACTGRNIIGDHDGGVGGTAGFSMVGGTTGWAGTFGQAAGTDGWAGSFGQAAGTDGWAGTFGQAAGADGWAGTFGQAGTTGAAGVGSGGFIGEDCRFAAGGAPGDLVFAAPVQYRTDLDSYTAALGDLNGDGKLDILVGNTYEPGGPGGTTGAGGNAGVSGGAGQSGGGSISRFLNAGNGSFGGPSHFLYGSRSLKVAAGDLSNDGKNDVVTTDIAGVNVVINAGDGSFGAPINFATGVGPIGVAIGDLNGDGRNDLAVANGGGWNNGTETDGDVGVLFNMGSGAFVAVNLPAGTRPVALAIADLNGDGRPDLPVASGASVSVILNNGSGTFSAPAVYGAGTNPRAIAVGDLNGDGKPDLAVNNGNNGVSVLLNLGNGSFAAAVNYNGLTIFGSISIGDLNGDGRPDLVGPSHWSCGSAAVLLNNGNGTFSGPRGVHVGFNPTMVALGDLDGNGRIDLVTVNREGAAVVLNQGP
jgi:hypothetical protein